MTRRVVGVGGGPQRRSARPGGDAVEQLTAGSSGSTLILCSLLVVSKVAGATFGYAALAGHHLPEPLFLGIALLSASAVLLVLQRPWRPAEARSLTPPRLRRVALGGLAQAVMLGAWIAGLRASGPLRAFLVEGAELPLLYLFAVLTTSDMPNKKKTRGAVFMILGYLLLLYEASGRMSRHVEHLRHTRLGHRADVWGNATKHHLQHKLHEFDNMRKHHHDPHAEHLAPPHLATHQAPNHTDAAANLTVVEAAKPHPPMDDDAKPAGAVHRRLLRAVGDVDVEHEDYDHEEEDHEHEHEHDDQEEDEEYDEYDYDDYDEDYYDGYDGEDGEHGDDEHITKTDEHLEPVKRNVLHHIFLSKALRSELGILLLLATAVINQSSRAFTRRVATEVGGAKRYFSLSTVFATAFTLPFSLISLVLMPAKNRALLLTSWSVYLSIAAGVVFVVVPFYLRAIVSSHMRQASLLKLGLAGPAVVCFVGGFLPRIHALAGHRPGLVVLIVLIVEMVGLNIMTSGRMAQELPTTDPRGK